MVSKWLTERFSDPRWSPPLCLFWLIFTALHVVGCAAPQLFTRTVQQEEVQVSPGRIARTFPDFVAVIAQPGDTFSSLAGKYLQDPSMDWLISEFNDITYLVPGQELIIPLNAYEKGGLTLGGYQTVPVLSYHKFSKSIEDELTVSEKAFEEQMRFLKVNGYRVITMEEFFDFLDFKRQIPKKSVVITIDDGWRSAYDIAFPILKKYGYHATLFVYTDLIMRTDKSMRWEDVSEMAKSGLIDVQCHSKTHRSLLEEVDEESFGEYFEEIRRELTEPRRILNRRVNAEIEYMAYPYGETNQLVIALLEKLGYRGAFTVERGGNPFFVHHYRIKRCMIYGGLDLEDFKRNLNIRGNKALQ